MRKVALGSIFILWNLSAANAERVNPVLGLPSDPDAIVLTYGFDTGDLWVTQPEESTRGMTTLEIVSQSNSFKNIPCPFIFCGLFDFLGATKLFRLDPAGFDELRFPGVLEPGLSEDFLTNDLLVDGSMVGGGSLPQVVLIPIPEPSAQLLTCVASLAIVTFRRRSLRRS
jgi:hypothetical protein